MIKNLQINKKKIMSLLVATLMTFYSGTKASPSNEKYENLPIIYQRDDVFLKEEIKYNGYYFRDCGCGPSSVINMLISMFDYNSDDIVPLLKETLKVFAVNHLPEKYEISLDNVINILNSDYIEENKEKYPVLYKLFKEKNSDIKTLEKYFDFDEFQNILLDKKENKSMMIQSKIVISDNWDKIIELICYLYDLGEYNTNLYFSFTSVGTTDCDAPFHSGDSGHYVCMTINVKEFYEEGSFCILDSYRRAIFDEPYGDDEYYRKVYPFAEKPKKYKDFNEIFEAERISDTVIKLSLKAPYREELEEKRNFSNIDRNERITNYLTPLYNSVIFYSASLFIIDMPNNVKKLSKNNNKEIMEEYIDDENNKRCYFK